jgi:hypothetical protein
MTTTNKIANNFRKIINRYPQLLSILSKLNSSNIKYGLYAGTHTSILTSNRVPTDVDFLIADEDFVKLKKLFPLAKTKAIYNAEFLWLGENNEIDFMSQANAIIGDSHYLFRLTDLCWDNSELIESDDFEVRVLNKADTILLKAMLQRGKERGKHDLEDIKAITEQYPIDKGYLNKRLKEVNPDERLLSVLRKFDLI